MSSERRDVDCCAWCADLKWRDDLISINGDLACDRCMAKIEEGLMVIV